jgi:electron transport complex protein RnfC
MHDPEQLEARGILDCIECGGCDFVCPSSIPLTERLIRAKHEVWQQHAAARQADHARKRFEVRQRRSARATQERTRELDRQVAEVSGPEKVGKQTIDELMRRVESGKRGDDDKNKGDSEES